MRHHLYFVYVPKAYGDGTNHGLTSRVDMGQLFWDCTREEAIVWCQEHGYIPEDQFYLVKRELWGENHAYAEPLIKPEGHAQTFGGNYIASSDSNGYNQGYCRPAFPIPVHDRFETWEENDALGR